MSGIYAVLRGGPYDGVELALMGRVPTYMLLIDSPSETHPIPLVVGADFDDHWPGQQRYEVSDELLADVGGGYMPTVIYSHVEAT